MKFALAVAACACYVIVLLVVHVVHMRYGQVDVVLYAAVLDAVVATAIVGGLLLATPVRRTFSTFEKTQLLAIWLLAGYAFAISVPTLIDRSLSFYLLEKLRQRGGAIRADRFEDVFTTEYVREHRLVEVRLTEQLESGTISIVDGCVRLTARGQHLAHFSRLYRTHLLPRRRLLMGQYTDALTDPFRHSRGDAGYRCIQED